MNFAAHDNTVLVAPRPVRLAAPTPYTHFHPSVLQRSPARAAVRLVSAPTDTIDRLKLAEDVVDDDFKSDLVPTSDRDTVSPRASPRSGLTSEALEEFLSILHPSSVFLFPPTSPVLRASNANASTAFFPYRRSPSRLSPSGTADAAIGRNDQAGKENDIISYPLKFWTGDHLASPIARNIACNPFQRHPTYDNPVTTRFHSSATTPSPAPLSLPPTVVPLPPPTPNEDLSFSP